MLALPLPAAAFAVRVPRLAALLWASWSISPREVSYASLMWAGLRVRLSLGSSTVTVMAGAFGAPLTGTPHFR